VSRLVLAIVVTVLLALTGCTGGDSSAGAFAERSVEVADVTVAATPERVDANGAVIRLSLDTHTTPLSMDLPAAAHLIVGDQEWPARAWNGTAPGGHHRSGTLEFTASGPASGPVRLVIDGLGAPAELMWPQTPS
jgi:hypothetical protein